MTKVLAKNRNRKVFIQRLWNMSLKFRIKYMLVSWGKQSTWESPTVQNIVEMLKRVLEDISMYRQYMFLQKKKNYSQNYLMKCDTIQKATCADLFKRWPLPLMEWYPLNNQCSALPVCVTSCNTGPIRVGHLVKCVCFTVMERCLRRVIFPLLK